MQNPISASVPLLRDRANSSIFRPTKTALLLAAGGKESGGGAYFPQLCYQMAYNGGGAALLSATHRTYALANKVNSSVLPRQVAKAPLLSVPASADSATLMT